MKRRHAWLGVVGASGLLLTGCLFQRDSIRQPKGDEVVFAAEPAKEEMVPLRSSDGDVIPSPPAPPSDYHVRDKSAKLPEPDDAGKREAAVAAVTRKSAAAPEVVQASAPAPDAPLVAALRCALEKHPDQAKLVLAKYEKDDRELLLALVRLTAGVGEGEMEKLPPEEVSRTLEQLSAVTNNLKKKAPLTLDKVCFCKKIQGFGRYTPWAEGHEFQAGCGGQPGERVQVYAEVRNFGCKSDAGKYETTLESRLEIRDAERNEVANIDLGRCVDKSQTPRQDYFLNFQLHVPAKLPPGLYTLWLKVKDITTDPPRETSCSLDFQVTAAGVETESPESAKARP